MSEQLENIINNSFDVTATTEGWADPEFFSFSHSRRQRCSDWEIIKRKKEARAVCEKRSDDGELMNVIIACIGGGRQGCPLLTLGCCSLFVRRPRETALPLAALPTLRRRTLACERRRV